MSTPAAPAPPATPAPSTPAAPPSIPVSSPKTPEAKPMNSANITPPKINAARELGLTPQRKGPKEMFGDKAAPKQAASDGRSVVKGLLTRHRDPATGKFVEAAKTPDAKTPAAAPKTHPAAPETPEPTGDAPEPTPAVPEAPKLKIGGKEMTAEEAEHYVADLEAKAAAAAKPPEAPKAPETPAAPEAPQPTLEQLRQQFIDRERQGLTQEQFDDMLSSSDGAAKLAAYIAEQRAKDREYLTGMVQKLADRIETLGPVEEHFSRIQEYQRDQAFVAAHPDIATHKEGPVVAKQVREALARKYDKAVRMQAANVADADDLEYIRQYENSTPEDFDRDVAHWTRRKLGLPTDGAPAATPSAAPAPAPNPAPAPAAAPRPQPPRGQSPSGGAPQVVQSTQASAIARARAARGAR